MAGNKNTNREISGELNRIADLLEMKDGQSHRIRAYRDAASQIEDEEQNISRLVEKGNEDKLREIPGIGEKLQGLITEFVKTGRTGLRNRLEGEADPVSLFAEVPGIGKKMASRIAEELDISSLEELEQAAHDGRLEEVKGFGERRVKGVKSALAGILSRSARRRVQSGGDGDLDKPPVSLLLETDREYREKAQNDELKKIAPRRFNPEGEKWLPIMKTGRKGWKMTALFSNTKRAHELGKTDQWVVIYYEKGDNKGQATVVNGRSGRLRGRRVVRGREKECREYYKDKT
ncbi:MAG: helix-hairpin-helix domain-containing protein [Candidatus Krumholzibacteriales bacterium]